MPLLEHVRSSCDSLIDDFGFRNIIATVTQQHNEDSPSYFKAIYQANLITMMRIFLITVLAMLGVSSAFVAPMQRAQVVKPASPTFIFQMSEDPTQEKASSDGTFYDDEVDLTPVKPALSNSMKERLIAEAQSGMDPNKKQTNVILYISVAVAILVALAGSGILF